MQEESSQLTLVVMGGLTSSPKESCELDEAIHDINGLNPDIVMIPGDLGDVSQGFDYACKTLGRFKATVLPAIGDRDLIVETCKTDEENVELFVNAFNLVRPYHVHEHSSILFVTLSSERHRAHEWQHDEVFLSEEQLTWFQDLLANNPSTPTVVQCHAPVFGSHVPVESSSHVLATNAYINHNHQPERLLEVIQQHPQITFWFSSHAHLGQGYPNSICFQNGVCFVHVGTHSSQATHDEARHSRVVYIQSKRIYIRTFDHALRQIDPRHDYELDGGPNRLMDRWEVSTPSGFLSGGIRGFHVDATGLHLKPLPTSHYLNYLDKPASAYIHAICPTVRKVYVATQGGYVWEYDRISGLPLGAIDIGKEPNCVVATDSVVWSGGDGYLRKVIIDAPERFLRSDEAEVPRGNIPIKGVVRAMRLIDRARLLVGADRRLYEMNLNTDELLPKAVFKKDVLAIQPLQEKLYVLTADCQMSVFTLADLQPLQTLQLPSDVSGTDTPFFPDFAHATDQFCFFASRQYHDIIKVSLSDMKIVDQLRLQGKVQTVLFDKDEIYTLTASGQLLRIDMQNMAIKWVRDLEMKAASTMAIDKRFVYVATANAHNRWQEVQVIERRSDMRGSLTYSVRTANLIQPELEIDTDVGKGHIFRPQLRAKVDEKWVNLEQELYPSREFEIRITLERGEATTAPSISSIELKDKN